MSLFNKIYTSVIKKGNTFSYRLRDLHSGKSTIYDDKLKPRLYKKSDLPNTIWMTVNNINVDEMIFESVSDAERYIDNNDDVYGMDNWETQSIYNLFPEDLTTVDTSKIVIDGMDIEVFSGENGPFPDAKEAKYPIVMISHKRFSENKMYLFTLTDYTHNADDPDVGKLNVDVRMFKTEQDMLKAYVKWLKEDYPDVLTGWNIETFDIPYIVNRIKNLSTPDFITLYDLAPSYTQSMETLSLDLVNHLSPFYIVKERTVKDQYENEIQTYDIYGVSILDYLDLYKKFTYVTQPEYSLGFISSLVLGVSKLEYDEGSINDFFIQNPYNYTKYNIRDTELIHAMENSLQFINTVFILAYMSKCKYEEALKTVRPWDSLLYGMLLQRYQVVPLMKKQEKVPYPGAYVKLPKPGIYRHTVAVDLNSLYPHIMMQWNIGPETILEYDQLPDEIKHLYKFIKIEIGEDGKPYPVGIDDLILKHTDLSLLKKYHITMAGNAVFFRTDITSIFSEKVKEIYESRKREKKKMNVMKSHLEENKSSMSAAEILKAKSEISRLNGLQMAYKIFMNSLYGATGTPYFRWYHNDVASAITCSGQWANRWIERKINELIIKLTGMEGDYVIYADTDSLHYNSIVNINGHDIMIGELYEQMPEFVFDKFRDSSDITKFNLGDNKVLSYNTYRNNVQQYNLKYVKKHTVEKEMFRIYYNNTYVDITADHSIMVRRNGKVIPCKPAGVLSTDQLISVSK